MEKEKNTECVCGHKKNVHREGKYRCNGRAGSFSPSCVCEYFIEEE